MKLLAPLVLALATTFSLQGYAETSQQSEEQMLTILKGEIEALYEQFSPIPFRPIRKEELNRLLVSAGYKWHHRAKDYSKQGPREEGRRREEYVVIPTFCAAPDDKDPWVSKLVFQALGVRDDSPANFIKQVRASSVLNRISRLMQETEFSVIVFRAQFLPTASGQIALGSGEAHSSASSKYSQRITLFMQIDCPAN